MGRTILEVLGEDGEYHEMPSITVTPTVDQLFADPARLGARIHAMAEQQFVIRTLFGEPPKPTRRQRVRALVMYRREALARKLAPWAVDE